MKQLILSGLILATMGITIIGCNKEKIVPSKKTIAIENELSNSTILTENQLQYVGNYHNESLSLIFNNFNWKSNNLKQELIDNIDSNSIKLNDYSNDYLNSRCINDYESNYNVLKENLSIESFLIIDNSINLSKNISDITIFNNEINFLQEKAKIEISDIAELNTILVTLEVLKSSAYFWSPKSVGGSGIGYNYITLFNNQNRTGPKDILAADGVSAGIGMLGVAVAGMLGPIGWGALAIVGGEAAMSSGAALLF
jgi:hypothetical protein